MKLQKDVVLPAVGLTGFEPPMTEEESAIQSTVHRFAKNVLRPLGRELDRMSAEQVVAPGSPYYSVFAEAARLGLPGAGSGQGSSGWGDGFGSSHSSRGLHW